MLREVVNSESDYSQTAVVVHRIDECLLLFRHAPAVPFDFDREEMPGCKLTENVRTSSEGEFDIPGRLSNTQLCGSRIKALRPSTSRVQREVRETRRLDFTLPTLRLRGSA